MATQLSTIEYITDQIRALGNIRYRKMFGEYAIYCDDKVVALVCDDVLFVKPTVVGKNFIGDVNEAPPYPNAKPYFVIEDQLDDDEWLCQLIRITCDALPTPQRKKQSKSFDKAL